MSAPVKDMLVAPHGYFQAALALTSNMVAALTCIASKVELLFFMFPKSSQRVWVSHSTPIKPLCRNSRWICACG